MAALLIELLIGIVLMCPYVMISESTLFDLLLKYFLQVQFPR